MTTKEIGRGAEAIIILKRDDPKNKISVIKQRPAKKYRHKQIDSTLRKTRTKKEAKILMDLERLGVKAPKLIRADLGEGVIEMSYVEGDKLRDVFDEEPEYAEQLGNQMTILHDANIIHGDLTTSNIIVTPKKKLALIDFGLTIHSTRLEDKAVDLHLFKQALESKHPEVAKKGWQIFLKGYNPKERKEILQRLKLVERRGRNKE